MTDQLSNDNRQQDPLLIAKFYAPKLRAETLRRSRLVDRLDRGLLGKLTLISAPAGFGKSTLLADWRAGISAKSGAQSISWFSVDPRDNDPVRFWSYFIMALGKFWPEIKDQTLAILHSPSPPPLEMMFTGLMNGICRISGNNPAAEPNILVLDDYQWIESTEIHEMLANFLEYQPESLHLVISTRVDPPLPLARFRARGQLAELRAADLRFTRDEAAQFLEKAGLPLTDEMISKLENRTEGWVAGLQLAALSMRERDDWTAFLDGFTGSHRHIIDYLTEEVLVRQPREIQDFLLKTSILEQLNGPLCDAVTGRSGSQRILEKLQQSNLFLIALDDERCWYRYHQLFAEMLRTRLAKVPSPTDMDYVAPSESHLRASLWYETNGRINEAVSHALAAGDVQRSALLIEKYVEEILLSWESVTLLKWLAILPETLVKSRPYLCLAYAMALLGSARFEQVEPWLQSAESFLKTAPGAGADCDDPALPAEIKMLLGRIDAVRSTVAINLNYHDQAIALSLRALKRLPEKDMPMKGIIALNLGDAYAYHGQGAEAIAAFNESVALSLACRNDGLAIVALASLGALFTGEGKLNQAAATFHQALEIARKPAGLLPMAGKACVFGGRIYLERYQLGEALTNIQNGIELCRQWGHREHTVDGYIALADTYGAMGDFEAAWKALHTAQQLVDSACPNNSAGGGKFMFQKDSIAETEARLWLSLGNLEAVHHWAVNQGFFNDNQPEVRWGHAILAKLLMATGRPEPAVKILADGIRQLNAIGYTGYTIRLLALQAVACRLLGEDVPAMQILEKALRMAEPEGYIQSFAGAGTEINSLLLKALSQGILPIYVSRLLTIVDPKPVEAFDKAGGTDPASGQRLIDALSDRELEILRLLSTGQSNPEIAAQLFLAVGTVKKHLNNIYGKLGVTSRTQALLQAKTLGLI
jgi:LuxR family maltose regulon positive regulatory protein